MNYLRTRREQELRFICCFVADNDLSIPIVIQQLQSLWTAYCIHCDYEPDTSDYDSDLSVVWIAITEKYGKTEAKLCDFERFDLFMGDLLDGVQ